MAEETGPLAHDVSFCSASASIFPCRQPLFKEISKSTKDTIIVPKAGKPDELHRVVEGQIPDDLTAALTEGFTEFEILEIAHRCDAYAARGGHETPIALWIFGPPAAGKSTVTDERACDLFGQADDAVTIDGDIFRKVHKGFQMVTLHGSRNGLVHKDAWNTLKKTGHMDRMKEGIVDHAVENRQHLKIPEAAVSEKRIYGMLERLEAVGYEMHAICLWAPKTVTEARGRPRSVKEGKAFSVSAYHTSTENTLNFGKHWEEQIAKGNPHYKSVKYYDNTTFPSYLLHALEFEQLTNFTDDEATDHAKMSEMSRYEKAMSEEAEVEARVQGVVNPDAMRARAQAFLASASMRSDDASVQRGKPSFSESAESPKGGDAVRRRKSTWQGATWYDPAFHSARHRRSRLEGFIAGVISGIVVVSIFFLFLRSSGGARVEL